MVDGRWQPLPATFGINHQPSTIQREGSAMKWLLTLMVLIVYVLHQDFWLWGDRTLVLGFLPVGLAYHAFYSILAAIMMAVLVRFAWPAHLEEAETADSRRGVGMDG